MRWLRTLAAATVALAAVMGPMVVTTSSAAARGPAMCITRFYVDETEDFGPDGDEPYLKVNTVFWDPLGSLDEPAEVAVQRTVHAGDVVQAWDEDTGTRIDGDDLIGAETVKASAGTLIFKNDDAQYRADYKFGSCP